MGHQSIFRAQSKREITVCRAEAYFLASSEFVAYLAGKLTSKEVN